MNKISDVMATLEEMRKIYQFDDEKTYVSFSRNPLCGYDNNIEIYTTDVETGVNVHLSKDLPKNNTEND